MQLRNHRNSQICNLIRYQSLFSLVGAMKISTVCLPLRFKRDETFENSNVIVSGFGDELKNGSKLFEHLRELHPDGILNENSILFFVKLYLNT